MKTFRRPLTAAAAAAAAVGLAGCFPFIQSDAARQAAPMAGVQVDTELCSSPLLAAIVEGGGVIEGLDDLCTDAEQAVEWHYGDFEEYAIPLPGQVMLAYRVPDGAEAPEAISASTKIVAFEDWWEYFTNGGGSGGGTGTGTTSERPDPPAPRDAEITFRRSTELDGKLPAFYARTDDEDPENDADGIDIVGEGHKIVAYVSDVVPGAVVGEWDVRTEFGLPSAKRPYAGPFNHVSMIGWRAAMTPELEPEEEDVRALRAAGIVRGGVFGDYFGELDPTRAIDCRLGGFLPTSGGGELRRKLRGDGGAEIDLSICPFPKLRFGDGETEPQISLIDAFDGTDTATRDLDVRGGGETFAEQGTTATVPFKLVGAGAAGGKLDLVASVSPAIPGLGDVTAEIDFAGTGTTARDVELKLPADAPARTYEVTLTAASTSGAKRAAKAGLVVLPKKATQAVETSAGTATTRATQSTRRGNVFMDAQGYLRFGNVCGECSVDGLVPFGSVGDKAARGAQARTGRLLRVARAGRLAGKPGVRTKVRVKLFPKAQRSLRRGRKLTGVLVFRSGKSGVPKVRKVIFRTRAAK